MNTRIKGNRIQRKCIELLEDEGFLVDKVEKTGKFQKQKDLFGLFDLIAIKPDVVRLVQVTCNRPHTHKEYLEFSKHYPIASCYQYVWLDRKGWKTFWYVGGKKLVLK